jgi:hypothetical protein
VNFDKKIQYAAILEDAVIYFEDIFAKKKRPSVAAAARFMNSKYLIGQCSSYLRRLRCKIETAVNEANQSNEEQRR